MENIFCFFKNQTLFRNEIVAFDNICRTCSESRFEKIKNCQQNELKKLFWRWRFVIFIRQWFSLLRCEWKIAEHEMFISVLGYKEKLQCRNYSSKWGKGCDKWLHESQPKSWWKWVQSRKRFIAENRKVRQVSRWWNV